MNWRDTLIGSGITLIVTILAGLFIYYFTKEPVAPAAQEHIVYSVETSASFGVNPDAISFFTISVKNIGSRAAHNVRVIGTFPHGYFIQSKQFTSSSKITATTIIDKSSNENVDVLVPDMVPSESTTISLLVKGPTGLKPDVSVRSDDSIGNVEEPMPSSKTKDNANKKTVLSLMVGVAAVALALGLQAVLTFVVLPRLRSGRGYGSAEARLNNTAFLWLQEGLADETVKLLYFAISMRGAEPLLIVNYGLALGLAGDAEAARKHFEIARWWATSRHERAVVAFNEAILLIKEKKPVSEIVERLREAFTNSRKQIAQYCNINIFIREAIEAVPELRTVIERQGR